MALGIIFAVISLAVILLLLNEAKKQNSCPHCGAKLEWQDHGKEMSPLGHNAVKQVGYCPKCRLDISVRYRDDVYY